MLGTASQAPTRYRNQNGYLLRWDDLGILFDPGEGAQRQMLLAGVSAYDIDRICITHFHGDHCLGVPGVVQRLSLDRVPQTVHAHYPASGADYFHRLRYAASFHETATLQEDPVSGDGVIATGPFGMLESRQLDHRIETYGYRLVEPDTRRMLPAELSRWDISGPDVGRLQREGALTRGGRRVTVEEVSTPRPGQRFAFIMDTRLCDGVYALAEGADMLVIESTFRHADAGMAEEYGHLTTVQAAKVAAECGAKRLVLTHFSARYPDSQGFHDEAATVFDGDIVVAEDLARIPVPARRPH